MITHASSQAVGVEGSQGPSGTPALVAADHPPIIQVSDPVSGQNFCLEPSVSAVAGSAMHPRYYHRYRSARRAEVSIERSEVMSLIRIASLRTPFENRI